MFFAEGVENPAKGGNKKEHCDKMIQEAITLIDEMV